MTTIDKRPWTTGIGSLPHHNVDAALEHSFRFGIPYLPQIPIRNPWEYMIAQALEGLPGLQAGKDGSVTLNTDIWFSRTSDFNAKLESAFRGGASSTPLSALSLFEPTPSISSCWQPFIWELAERETPIAKMQIAGPMTSQWVLQLHDSSGKSISALAFGEKNPELSTQIFRLVMARALAMSARIKEQGAQPLLFLDEPGLYGFSPSNPRHVMALQELKVMIQALRKEGVLVGLHCCSNTDWNAVLALPLNYLSIDVSLSLGSLLACGPGLRRFIESDGRLALGVIPTGRPGILRSLDVGALVQALIGDLKSAFGADQDLVRKVLKQALYTPACGLALQSVADAELIFEMLSQFEAQVDDATRSI
ncbi:hypothetical protein WDW37_00615 [Bdellovibrionota bacterium FG-1]